MLPADIDLAKNAVYDNMVDLEAGTGVCPKYRQNRRYERCMDA